MNTDTTQTQSYNITATKTFSEININKTYVISLIGILRALLIAIQIAGCISAASIPKLVSGEFYLIGEIEHIRNAYLFFSIVGLFISMFLYAIFSLDLIDFWPILLKVPWRLIVSLKSCFIYS